MAGGLKCPKCKRKGAYIQYGTLAGRRYKQKHCPSCGYEGKRVYYGRPLKDWEVRGHLKGKAGRDVSLGTVSEADSNWAWRTARRIFKDTHTITSVRLKK